MDRYRRDSSGVVARTDGGGGPAMAKFEARRDALGLAEVSRKLREAFKDVSDGKRKLKEEDKEPEKKRKKEKGKSSTDVLDSQPTSDGEKVREAHHAGVKATVDDSEDTNGERMEEDPSSNPSEAEVGGHNEADGPTDTSFERSLQSLRKVQAECMKAELVRTKKVNKMKESEKGVYIDICGRFSTKLAVAMVDSLHRLRAMMGKRVTDPGPLGSNLSEDIEIPREGLERTLAPSTSYSKIRLWSQIHALNAEIVGHTRHAIQRSLSEADAVGGNLRTSDSPEERKKQTFKDVYFSMFADAFGDDLDEMRKQEEKNSKRGSINVELIKQAIEMGTDIFEPWEQELLVDQHLAQRPGH